MSVAWYGKAFFCTFHTFEGGENIQQNTFTRWVNDELKLRGLKVDDVKTDLKDGLMLINLMEIISGKKIGRYNKHPVIIQQKLENLNIALNFMKKEGLEFVNIGAEDIAGGNLRIILGLLWTIILRYEINRNGDNDLLKWIQSKIPEYGIKNFTKNWNDGRALNGLINALRPDLCKDHKSLEKKNKLANATRGIDIADKEMGVDKLILPEEMIHKKVDKHAMMTYLAQFRNLKPVNPASRVRVYGPGVTQGVQDSKAPFYIEKPIDCKGKLEVKVVDKSGKEVKHDFKKAATAPRNIDKYVASYVPKTPGTYKVHVTLDGEHVPGSVFTVIVDAELSVGGAGKILCFFSTTSSNIKQRKDIQGAKLLLQAKKIHLRKDFVPWIPVDILDKKDREKIFLKAGTRTLPIIIVDDKYVGDYDTIRELDENDKLDDLLKMDGQKLLTEEEHKQRLMKYNASGDKI